MTTAAATIEDHSYDCHETDQNWRFGVYLDPEARHVSHWYTYGSGIPDPVHKNRALIIPLPFGAVGTAVKTILHGERFRGLVAELFSRYLGPEWNGSNYVGKWASCEEYSQVDELTEALEALFDAVDIYWNAADWFIEGGPWGENEADEIRHRIVEGESIAELADRFICSAACEGAHLYPLDVQGQIEMLLEQYPEESDCDVCKPSITTE